MTEQLDSGYDVVVVGGGAAGLSGALMLARARRSVVVIDAGAPRNAPADGVHGLLARDGMSPADLVERGQVEVRGYGGQIVAGEVESVTRVDDGFEVTLADGRTTQARRVLVTTGLVDELPAVPGLWERWGRDVLHCPYCHGWEVRDRAIGVVASGPMSVHQVLLLRQWSADLTYFTHDRPSPTGAEREQLAARGIRVVEGAVASLEIVDDRITGVRLSDGTVVEREVVAVSPRMVARAGFVGTLGLKPVEHSSGMGEHIPCEAGGRTEVPGVWVAGNITDLSAQVGGAAAAGATAGGGINADLGTEDTRRAVDAFREKSGEFDKEFWEKHYSGHAVSPATPPSAQLVSEVADLAPGKALDAGCGEGADAGWLAARGWRVTAVDIADGALRRAREYADTLGADISARIDWEQADLTEWAPPEEHFDLVTTHYVHASGSSREELFRRLAAAVRPGGTLLIVGHHPTDPHASAHTSEAHVFFTADEIAAGLDQATWEIAVAETRYRTITSPDGHEMTLHDTVLRARRRD